MTEVPKTHMHRGCADCCRRAAHAPADDPDQPVRPRLRAGLSTLQRSSAAAAAAGTAAVGSSTAFTSSPAPAVTTAASPAQLPPAAARPGAAVQMVQLSPLPGEGVSMSMPWVWLRCDVLSRSVLRAQMAVRIRLTLFLVCL
jgi:hypothetical protein